ncbi:HdaA/DnaA family protein [Candidatus Tisiphia endosymbiont of Beris chalybata]|uniref:HdaA/DnaA family protein n=1 Tax=Candidatus Tisiphia endosymbiont of Beris chalybata TaxID=3066262 RepID=UPI00312C850B
MIQDSQQYILPLFDNVLYPLDNFINSPSNQAAYEAINNWPNIWGIKPYELVLLIYGPSSSGKTYLTKIWQSLTDALVITKDLNILSNELISRYNAFIIEDIEGLEEREILHSFNLLNESGKYLLMTTSSLTNSFALPDLSSRINASLQIKINPADDELITKLIFKYFSEHSIMVNEQVIKYLLTHLPRQCAEIIKTLAKITHFALVHKHAITISLIKNVLSNASSD